MVCAHMDTSNIKIPFPGNHWADPHLPRENHSGPLVGNDRWRDFAQRVLHVQHRRRAHQHFFRLLLFEVRVCVWVNG